MNRRTLFRTLFAAPAVAAAAPPKPKDTITLRPCSSWECACRHALCYIDQSGKYAKCINPRCGQHGVVVAVPTFEAQKVKRIEAGR